MELRIVEDKNTFDTFVKENKYKHFAKTSMWGEFKKRESNLDYFLLGFYEKDQLIGTALALFGKQYGQKYLYVPKGPCIDYENDAVRTEAFKLLKQFADEKNVTFLRVDPNVTRKPHDIDGNVLEGFNNEYITEDLIHNGFRHKGYGYGYDGSWFNRYTLVVDLHDDIKTIRSRFSSSKKWGLNKAKKLGVSARLGDQSNITDLMVLQKQLSERKGFVPSKAEYFEALIESFKENIDIYIAEIDMPVALEAARADLKKKEEKGGDKQIANAKKVLSLFEKYMHDYPQKMTIAAGVFITLGDTTWCLHYYFHKEFNMFSPLDTLNFYVMSEKKEHGVCYYDLCGFSGKTTKDDPEYPLYEYKRKFGSFYVEQIGEFDYIRKENAMKRYKFITRAVNHVKRRYHIAKYKTK